MSKTFTIICMFPAFNYKTNLYSQTIMNNYQYKQYKEDQDVDIYLIGSFITKKDYDLIKKLKNKTKILWLSEPIIHHFKYPYTLIQENEFTLIYGCVLNKPLSCRYKLPLYINYYKAYQHEHYYDQTYFQSINEKYKLTHIDDLLKKKFCTMIARHDNWNTRKQLFTELTKVGHIICPSLLFNNFDNKEFEKTGKHDFLKNFIFNICPENSEGNFPGYVTEKLMDACISGTLPIYYGKLDNIDQNIFNIKRVLFYIPSCKITVTNVVEKIKRLMNCPNELFDFYNQDIFNKDAHIYINQMIHAFKNKVDTI